MRRASLSALCAVTLAGLTATWVGAQEEEGLGSAPGEARDAISRAIEAMGGREVLDRVHAARFVTVVDEDDLVRERHQLYLNGRLFHYTCRQAGGLEFEVVLAHGLSFMLDRDDAGNPVEVTDLTPDVAAEGCYERDLLFMPLLLPMLLDTEGLPMDTRGPNSVGDIVIRVLIPQPEGSPVEPFVVRLRFDRDTHLLVGAMGQIPTGPDAGTKRWIEYSDYTEYGPLRLPNTYSDQRGEEAEALFQHIEWELNPELEEEVFLRPIIPEDEDD